MENLKPFYLSKTFWTNVLMFVVVYFLPESIKPMIQNPETLASIFAVVNIILRFVTKDKVTIS